jgi:hypothetical protein
MEEGREGGREERSGMFLSDLVSIWSLSQLLLRRGVVFSHIWIWHSGIRACRKFFLFLFLFFSYLL